MGDCVFKLEEDPDVRIIARGSYGEAVVVDAHYPAGDLQLADLPAGTTSLAATMVYTNPQGIVQTGNVEFAFHNPHPGCGPATSPTPTPTPTLTTTVPVETPPRLIHLWRRSRPPRPMHRQAACPPRPHRPQPARPRRRQRLKGQPG